MTAARRERRALVATFREVGPQAPTLCEGWNTTDLAAHLVVRERRLDATAGIAFLSGRAAVRLEFDGDPQTVAAVKAAPRGL